MFVISMFDLLMFGRSAVRACEVVVPLGISRPIYDNCHLSLFHALLPSPLPFLAPRSSSLHPIPALLQGTHRARSDTTARTRAMETSVCLECRPLGTSTARSMVVTSITGAVVYS
ncbi:hypothetical protein DFP72DRAFT_935456 [Ephemerocybe angulata]|uniref:Secreted protein n=1 Tax=Ephemerocybe angulata TaxID=980116 RepID=A0A8H6H9V7_9AGAR|nr:hypothetical protein DFP72DRAFT_935456 [Tulosesus angulatus]